MNGHKYTNRLIHEKSPYLLQHAHNPVDWVPWGDAAFAKAKLEDKPIFLSIGYSTCHWCHVMERESFEQQEVADILNRHFVSIKVDREERPDVDQVYMTVCQAMTGSGGWPLTCILTPEGEPFFAGTYLPRHRRGGMMGLVDLLQRVASLWKESREDLIESGRQIAEWLQTEHDSEPGTISDDVFDEAFDAFANVFDESYGGFGRAPKFPTPHHLMFLLRYHHAFGEARALTMVGKTLDAMASGGIYDQIGFGFSRYSTDREWLVPHFEKMLYDNALLLQIYLEAYQATGEPFYARIAGEIIEYVQRDMTGPEGAFYSAEDADSQGEEGLFYTWTKSEIEALLDERAPEYCGVYDISKNGNFEGRNIPNLIGYEGFKDVRPSFENERGKLFEARSKRVRPALDDKVLTGWNGLMIAGLARAARVLENRDYYDAAARAARFILEKLVREDGRLLARYRDGEARYPAYSPDYAYFISGLLELYEAGFEPGFLEAALGLNRDLIKLFWDETKGGLYYTGSDAEALLTRPKETDDGAIPSDNAVAALNWIRLSRLTGDPDHEMRAERSFRAFANPVMNQPTAHAFWLCALITARQPGREVVVVGQPDDGVVQALLADLNRRFDPFTTVLLKGMDDAGAIVNLAPFTASMTPVEGKAAVYICKGNACQAPVTDLPKAMREINRD